ncbi:MAG: EAL domain-containing protein, partial [Lutispora sp.]
IDSMGTTIAHEKREEIRNRVNIILDWEMLGLDKSIHDFFITMQKNDKGAGQYIFDGIKTYAGYARIEGTYWHFGISAPRTQVFSSINQVYFFVGFLLLMIIVIFSAAQIYIRILRKNLRTEKNTAAAAIDTANLIILGIDKEGIIYDFNRHAEAKLGYKKAEIAGSMELEDIVDPKAMDSYSKLMKHVRDGISLSGLELSLKSKTGENIYILWNLSTIPDFEDEYFEIVGMDISERIKIEKDLIESHEELTSIYEELYASEETLREQYEELAEKEKKIHKLAYYDPLTELANRVSLESYFNSNVYNKRKNAALLYMDLDNFKFVNDTFGHSLGDKLLVQIAENIRAIIGCRYIAARLGGDEFMILIDDYKHLDEVKFFGDKLLKSFEHSFHLENSSVNISTSIGIALYPDNGQTFGELMKCADTAMYAAKEGGRRNYVFFNQEMNDSIVKKMNIQNSIKKGIKNNEFLLYYQPQYEIKTREIKGFEALLRWDSPEHGYIPPLDFIGIAENSGLIIPLGEWVISEACDFIKDIINMGREDISVSVNVSVVQLLQDSFVPMVASILQGKNLKPQYLELEITESVLIEDMDSNLNKIRELRALGIKVSLDDFGTGYSSLTYLRELPINILKIDKSFIDNILATDEKGSLAGSIISLAHDLDLKVVAEGVEEEVQLSYLERFNCDMVQGYLFSKPLPRDKAVKLIVR